MKRAAPAIAYTVSAASVLLLGIAFAALGANEQATWTGFAYGLSAVLLIAGWLPVLAREAVQDWRRYGRGEDE